MRNSEIENRPHDMPEHEVGQTSSIGGVGAPSESSFGRLKGIHETVISNQGQLGKYFLEFQDSITRLGGEFTRTQHRAIIDQSLLGDLVEGGWSQYVEAVVPLDPGRFGNHPSLLYLSHNLEERSQNQQDIEMIHQNIQIAQEISLANLDEIFSRPNINDYEVGIVDISRVDDSFIDQLHGLYERFGWGREEVVDIVNNPDIILGVARHEDEIVSAGIAELGSIPLAGGLELNIAEITEAATLENHGSNGLYTAISTSLLMELADRSQVGGFGPHGLDLVFGECNGLSLPVLIVSAKQGRQFAIDHTQSLRFEGGLLCQQVPIGGVERSTDFNDLVVTYLAGSQLIKMYGEGR